MATFDYAAWLVLFPAFSGAVSQPQAQSFFDTACVIWRNDGTGPVRTVAQQLNILNWLTAHIAALFGASADGQPAETRVVGRIASASEGSVSVSTDWAAATNNQAWFLQTQYGATFWQMTAAYRALGRWRVPPKVGGAVGPWRM